MIYTVIKDFVVWLLSPVIEFIVAYLGSKLADIAIFISKHHVLSNIFKYLTSNLK